MDITERLEKRASQAGMLLSDPPKPSPDMTLCTESAALIASQARRIEAAEASLSEKEREVERLRGALEPFAGYLDTAGYDLDNKGNPLPDDEGMGWVYLTVGDFRRARATLTSEAGHGG